MRVLVIGNSVALYVRPRSKGAKPYGRRLVEFANTLVREPSCVELWAGNSLTAADLVHDVEDKLVGFGPDAVIINVGIVECTPRVVPQRLRRRYVRGRTSWQRLWIAGERMIRGPILALTDGAPAMTPAGFGASLKRLIEVARNECGARVLCLGLPQTSRRVLGEVPSIDTHIQAFDAVIRNVCIATGAVYVDVATLVAQLGPEVAMPDGIHFSAAGHSAVACELARLIEGGADGHDLEAQAEAKDDVGVPAWTRIIGGLAAIPLTVLGVVWLFVVKSLRALARLRQG